MIIEDVLAVLNLGRGRVALYQEKNEMHTKKESQKLDARNNPLGHTLRKTLPKEGSVLYGGVVDRIHRQDEHKYANEQNRPAKQAVYRRSDVASYVRDDTCSETTRCHDSEKSSDRIDHNA